MVRHIAAAAALTDEWDDGMTPRLFLIIGGELLLFLGTVGYLGLLSKESWPWFWQDPGENLAHTLIGAVAVGIVLVPRVNAALAPYLRWVVIAIGIIALFFSVYGFLQIGQPEPNTFGLANLEHPFENLFHLVLATWAFLAAFDGPRRDREPADADAPGRAA